MCGATPARTVAQSSRTGWQHRKVQRPGLRKKTASSYAINMQKQVSVADVRAAVNEDNFPKLRRLMRQGGKPLLDATDAVMVTALWSC